MDPPVTGVADRAEKVVLVASEIATEIRDHVSRIMCFSKTRSDPVDQSYVPTPSGRYSLAKLRASMRAATEPRI